MDEHLFDDDFYDYIELFPPEEREEIIRIHLKYYNIDMCQFELLAMLADRNIEALKGKNNN